MKLDTFCLKHDNNTPLPVIGSINPTRSLILLFGASSLINQPQIFEQIAQSYPGIPMVGCSTAGEIICSQVNDETVMPESWDG